MRWPAVADKDKASVSQVSTAILKIWESDDRNYPENQRYFSRYSGFGEFQEIFPANISKAECLYSIIKIKIGDDWRYGLRVCEGMLPWLERNAGKFGDYEVVQLLKKDTDIYTVSDDYYGIKVFYKHVPEIDPKDLARVGLEATLAIRVWNKSKQSDNNYFSKHHGLGVRPKRIFPGDYSLVRVTIDGACHYGLRVCEEQLEWREAKTGTKVYYEPIQLLERRGDKYVVSNRQYGLKVSENDYCAVGRLKSVPSLSQLSEAGLISRLECGGDWFCALGQTMVTYEPYPGPNLELYLKKQFNNFTQMRQFEEFITIAKGLHHALKKVHQKKIIHRDLKPANIMYDYHNPKNKCRIQIVDVGLSKTKAETETTLPYAGTSGFLPLFQFHIGNQNQAQQADDKCYYNKQTDYESLGRMLYSIVNLMQESYLKRRLQTSLILVLIFADKPDSETFHNTIAELSITSESSSVRTYNNYFNAQLSATLDQNSSLQLNSLFKMADGGYEKAKRTNLATRVVHYDAQEYKAILESRKDLQQQVYLASKQAAIALLQNYASLWVMIFCFHWGRNNRSKVNDFLNTKNLDKLTLNEISSWTKREVLGASSGVNQVGSLARRCTFINNLATKAVIPQQTVPPAISCA